MRPSSFVRPVVFFALVAMTLGGVLAGSAIAARAQDATPTGELAANKALVLRYYDEVWNKGNLAAADETLTADFVWYNPPPTPIFVGPAAVKKQAADLRTAWPDMVLTADDVIAEGDRVVARWTIRATAQTENGRAFPIVYTGIDIVRIEGGKMAELWQNTDDAGLDAQYAAAAAPGTPAAGSPTP
ncbi:MAG TPA: ester cyclase [Thermomicrobiales bacterium]